MFTASSVRKNVSIQIVTISSVCQNVSHLVQADQGESARCTDYALRTGLSGLSLVSACCQSESSRLGRPSDFGPLSGRRTLRAPLPAALVHALPRAGDRCNLESSNGHSRNPPLFTHSSSNWSAGSSSADCVGFKSPRCDVQTNAGVREARLQMTGVGPNRPGE